MDLAAIFFLSLTGLISLILWLDNAQGITSNGVFKAVTIKGWLADPVNAPLDLSNYLYYPFMALLCHFLDLADVFRGDPRRQLTIINAFSAAVCLCIVYLLARRLTGRRSVAWAAVTFHLACAFFLNLAIINEDIMPSYTLMFGSMALASIWFSRPTNLQVASVALLFSVAWMFEWRLMFPTLPAMLLALTLSQGPPASRAFRVALFLFTMVAVAQIAIWLWGPQNRNPGLVIDLLWTGKGVGSGWAGFSAVKVSLLWAGMTQYLAGGANIGDPSAIQAFLPRMLWSTAAILIIGTLSIVLLWKDRQFAETRTLAGVFGVTFVIGEVMNLYSQPQDPQMQINVMVWLTIGWTLILGVASRWRPTVTLAIASVVSAALLAYNLAAIAPSRGADAAWRGALERIEQHTDPNWTVFLLHGFEQEVSEMYYKWDGDWDYFDKLGPAPEPKPKFKLLALVSGPVHKPQSTAIELAEDLSRQVNRAMDLGYHVVTNGLWTWSEAQFEGSMASVADVEKARALRRMLHEKFDAMSIFIDPVAGPYFRLRRR